VIVKVDAESGQVLLDNADDFRRFHVEAPNGFDAGSVTGIEQATGEESVWVSIDALKQWAGARPLEWSADFDKMVHGARSAGWVSHDGTAIRAHVERRHS
jgi:hypothetical protein